MKKCENINKYLNLVFKKSQLRYTRETVTLIVVDVSGSVGVWNEGGRIRNQRKNREHPEDTVVKISHNIQRSLAVSQNPVKVHQPLLLRKNRLV